MRTRKEFHEDAHTSLADAIDEGERAAAAVVVPIYGVYTADPLTGAKVAPAGTMRGTCGFAWLEVSPALGAALRARGIAARRRRGRLEVSVSELTRRRTLEERYAFGEAFASVLTACGFDALVLTRAD